MEMMREPIYDEPMINAEEVLAEWSTGSPSTTDSTPYTDVNVNGDIIMREAGPDNNYAGLAPISTRDSHRAKAWKAIMGWLPGRALRPDRRVDAETPYHDLPISREQAEEILGAEQYQEMMKKKKERQVAAVRRPSRLSLPWRRLSSSSASGSGHSQDAYDWTRKPAPLLPPMLKQDKGKNTLVLDMDETLVCAVFQPPPGGFDLTFPLFMESDPGGPMLPVAVYVSKRPSVDMFLQYMGRTFEVVVFTAGVRSYADPIIDMLDPTRTLVRHRLYREACTPAVGGLIKDLSLLGRDLRRVIIIDNTPFCYSLQPHNAIPISSFSGNKQDHDLLSLIPFRLDVSKEKNVIRSLENFA